MFKGTVWYRTPEGVVVEDTGTPPPKVPSDCQSMTWPEYQAQVKSLQDSASAAAEEARLEHLRKRDDLMTALASADPTLAAALTAFLGIPVSQ